MKLQTLAAYLSCENSLCCIETGPRCQPGALVAFIIDVDGVVLSSQPVQVAGLHSLCGLDFLYMLITENFRTRMTETAV